MGLIKKLTRLFSNEAVSSQAEQSLKAKAPKVFLMSEGDIKPIAVGFGGCIATDMILVDGQPIRFMYRTIPVDPADSGWAFLSGLESDAYMNDAANHGVYDVNTLANYDPSITPFLDAPAGSAFEKTPDSEVFIEVKDWIPPED
jgi:hypothetical protein